jgi:hypothetical protein
MTLWPIGSHLLHLFIGYRGVGPETGHPIRFLMVNDRHNAFFSIHWKFSFFVLLLRTGTGKIWNLSDYVPKVATTGHHNVEANSA